VLRRVLQFPMVVLIALGIGMPWLFGEGLIHSLIMHRSIPREWCWSLLAGAIAVLAGVAGLLAISAVTKSPLVPDWFARGAERSAKQTVHPARRWFAAFFVFVLATELVDIYVPGRSPLIWLGLPISIALAILAAIYLPRVEGGVLRRLRRGGEALGWKRKVHWVRRVRGRR
jgi:hypothetical protein